MKLEELAQIIRSKVTHLKTVRVSSSLISVAATNSWGKTDWRIEHALTYLISITGAYKWTRGIPSDDYTFYFE